MNAILQDQFQRVENALNALIDSIASYTPSTQAVETLLEADDELTRGLDQRQFTITLSLSNFSQFFLYVAEILGYQYRLIKPIMPKSSSCAKPALHYPIKSPLH